MTETCPTCGAPMLTPMETLPCERLGCGRPAEYVLRYDLIGAPEPVLSCANHAGQRGGAAGKYQGVETQAIGGHALALLRRLLAERGEWIALTEDEEWAHLPFDLRQLGYEVEARVAPDDGPEARVASPHMTASTAERSR